MTSVAIPRRRAEERRFRFADAAVDGGLGGFAWILYAFLYLPIAVVVVYAFNDSRQVAVWDGFGTRWWLLAWEDPAIVDALVLSTWTAAANALLATALGTAAALGARNVSPRIRVGFDALVLTALIVPEIVIAIASLLFFSTTVPSLLGPVAIVLTHAVFNTSVVTLLGRARLANMGRTADEAAADLGATPWETFRRVTFPLLLPAVLAGFLLSFTFSFDDVVLSTFVSTAGSSTLPLAIFSELRFGLSPRANVIATSMLGVTLIAVVTAQVLLRRGRPEEAS